LRGPYRRIRRLGVVLKVGAIFRVGSGMVQTVKREMVVSREPNICNQ
jgi:hypothetical protein